VVKENVIEEEDMAEEDMVEEDIVEADIEHKISNIFIFKYHFILKIKPF